VSELPEVSHYLARSPSPVGGRPPRKSISGGPDKEKSKEVREREKVEKRLTEVWSSGWVWFKVEVGLGLRKE